MCGLVYHDGKLYRNGREAGWLGNNGYRSLSVGNQKYLTHRYIWFMMKGEWPKGVLDHIDGDKLNNRIENLRDTNQVINGHNRRKCNRDNKTTGTLGVHKHQSKYRSQITINNKIISIGVFNTIEEANAAYLSYKP